MPGRREALVSEMLQRADPVQVRGNRIVAEHEAPGDRGRTHIQQPGTVHFRPGPAILGRVERHGGAQTHGRARGGRRARHLKSLLEKIITAPNSSAAMYIAA